MIVSVYIQNKTSMKLAKCTSGVIGNWQKLQGKCLDFK